ncbi:MAG: hypothetical protein AAFP81_07250 [Pseudomonadota bacterium]
MSDAANIVTLSNAIADEISELAEAAQDLTSQLNELENRVSSIKHDTHESVLRAKLHVQAKESESKTLLKRLSNAVERIQTEVVSESIAGLTTGLGRYQNENTDLISVVSASREHGSESTSVLQKCLTEVQTINTEFGAAILSVALHRNNLAGNFEEFDTTCTDLVQSMRDLGSELAESVKRETVELKDSASEFVQSDLVGQTSEKIEVLSDEIRQMLADDLPQRIEAAGGDFDAFVQDSVMAQFKKFLDALSEVVDEVIEALHTATSNSAGEREALDALIKQIEELTDPLLESFETVRGIGVAVGFDV